MTIAEHSDVDISKLFAWSKKFQVEDESGEVLGEFYIRLLGDADNSRARIFSLRRSADLRSKLKDPTSDDYVVAFSDINNIEKDRLIKLITVFSLRDISQNAMREVKIPLPKQPKSDAKTEQLEKYQAAVDAYPEKRELAIRDFIDKESKRFEKELNKLDISELRTRIIKTMEDELCEEELLKSYRSMSAFMGLYKDEELKEKLFKEYDEFQNLPTYIKQQFINAYQSLEMGGEDLKKLRAATQ